MTLHFKTLLPGIQTNAETLQLCIALQMLSIGGKLDVESLNVDAFAMSICSLMLTLEMEVPGTVEKYGWVRLSAVEQIAKTVEVATRAKLPDRG